jgi:hypothetical protein
MDDEMMFSLSYEQMTQMAGNKAMRFSQGWHPLCLGSEQGS